MALYPTPPVKNWMVLLGAVLLPTSQAIADSNAIADSSDSADSSANADSIANADGTVLTSVIRN